MKIVTVIGGARPQFIKAAVISRIIRKKHDEVIIHTGQHYDHNMSGIFFDELNIPEPDYNLGISGGGTHAEMTGAMLPAIEAVLKRENPPNMVLLYGDTNSTLAAALATVKLNIPICHIEAGNRLGTLTNPEEINRKCTDHMSTLLMCCTQSAYESLEKEGLSDRAYLLGDPMYDAFKYYEKRISEQDFIGLMGLNGEKYQLPEAYYYLTCHRAENVSSDYKLINILSAMNTLDLPTIYPVHPRNQKQILNICSKYNLNSIILIKPVGYKTSIGLIRDAKKIVTDSGGVQREAFFAGKQCVTIFDFVIWPETMVGNMNQLSKADKDEILYKLSCTPAPIIDYQPFGNGESGEKLLEILSTVDYDKRNEEQSI